MRKTAKGYSYRVTRKQIREYRQLSLRHKLEWLASANALCRKVLKGKTRRIWEAFRAGKI
ncbi:MAG: hypothetical protein ACOY3K_00890 [Candidatus Omnitrophota bacterium]